MVHASARSSRVRFLSRLAPVVTLTLASVGSFPGIASGTTPGSQLWAKRYNGTGNGLDSARATGVSPDGSKVFVTGQSTGSTSGLDYATVAYDASTGTKLWVRRYSGPRNHNDVATALGVSPDGSAVFVTGYTRRSTYNYATVAYDASAGTRLWSKRYSGPENGDDLAFALAVSPNASTVFVTGGSGGLASYQDYATIAYDASTGTKLWARRYNGPANGYDGANALGVSPDGSRVFVTGSTTSPSATDGDYATLAYDASSGTRLWKRRYNGPGIGDDFATALGVSPDGASVFVTGSSRVSLPDYDYATVAYDASSGTRLWKRRYNGPANSYDLASALRVSPDGSTVFVTGTSNGSTSSGDYATLAYSASSGTRLWVRRYNGPENRREDANALGVSPDGSTVFVTGDSAGLTRYLDYATIAYNASSGTTLWLRRHNGQANSNAIASALGVSPDGSRVFVTGESAGPTGYNDYATVAYAVA